MTDLLTPQNITFTLGVLAIIFSVFRYFKDPQVADDKKAALLSQQVQWAQEASERRFKDIQDNFNALLLQSNNHIHTVDIKVDSLATTMAAMSNEVTKLSTIIEERIPKK
jgi:hypothetical protein